LSRRPDSRFVYLGSASPRRRELLGQIGVRCELLAVGVDETPLPGEAPHDYVRRLAVAKARLARSRGPTPVADAPVLAADTAVVLRGEVLGKPADVASFTRMLGMLSGAEHEVYTAVAVVSGRGESVAVSRSEVAFREVTAEEIAAYWRTSEPADKAGGYAIQGLGAVFVRELRGSYSGVMGLPLYETAMLLGEHGVPVLDAGERS
jgi:septum formation protein